MPVPMAEIMVAISWLLSILSKRAFSTFRIFPLMGRMAWNFRSRPCFADPPALSPSTIKISQNFGSRSWQSASLPGSRAESRAPLRRVRSRALRAASRARGLDRLSQDLARQWRVLLEESAEVFIHGGFHDPLDLAVTQLGLGLPFKLRIAQLHADDG